MRNAARAKQLNDLFDSWAAPLGHSPFRDGPVFVTPRYRLGDMSVKPEQIKEGDVVRFTLYTGEHMIGGQLVPCHIIGAEGLVVATAVVIDGKTRPYFEWDGMPLPKEMLAA